MIQKQQTLIEILSIQTLLFAHVATTKQASRDMLVSNEKSDTFLFKFR